jgi:hypothetical protein
VDIGWWIAAATGVQFQNTAPYLQSPGGQKCLFTQNGQMPLIY